MLKDEAAGQDRQCLAVDHLRIDRDNRDTEKISYGTEKPLLIHLSGIEHLTRPGAAVEARCELHRFVA